MSSNIGHVPGNVTCDQNLFPVQSILSQTGLEIRGILVANATMFSHLLRGFSCGR